jgi:hypothetical protein
MSINLDILRSTRDFDVISPGVIEVRRSNARELKTLDILFLNGQKDRLSRVRIDTPYNLLQKLLEDFLLTEAYPAPIIRSPMEMITRKKLLAALYNTYKAKLVIYYNYNRYSAYPPQYIGLHFEDNKKKTIFLIKYGSVIQQVHRAI